MRLGIGRKLTLLFGALLLVLVIESVTSINALNQETRILEEIIVDSEAHEVMDELDVAVQRAFIGIVEYTELGSVLDEYTEARSQMDGFYTRLETLVATPLTESTPALVAERQEAIDDVAQLGVVLVDIENQMTNTIDAYNRDPQNDTTLTRNLENLNQTMDGSFHPLALVIDDVLTQEVDELHTLAVLDAEREFTLVVILDVIVFAIAIFGVLVLGRSITNSATHLAGAADAISRGDMDVPIDVKTGDEMQSLAESIDRMRISLKSAIARLSA